VASIWVTGSSAGIGLQTASTLFHSGHRVVLHARNEQRAEEVEQAVPGAAAVVIGDLASLEETKALATAAEKEGPFDAIVHNAGIGGVAGRDLTVDGLDPIFQVNALAPYVLTALMSPPGRLVYLSSGLHYQGSFDPDHVQQQQRIGDAMRAYCDSKLCDVLLAFAVARKWPTTLSNAVDPGWVKTRMGGRGAPDPVSLGADTQVWLTTSAETPVLVSGRYWARRREQSPNPAAYDERLQDGFLDVCASLSGARLPSS
jgi:NAD(P)-dependent dehydrogenase (short-subunit alcohol dehydrogenase family)